MNPADCPPEQLTDAVLPAPCDACPRADQMRALVRTNSELTKLNAKLKQAQDQLMRSEKLASIGQLAAGVAHEINNPVGYVFSNFGTLEKYLTDLFRVLAAYEKAESQLAGTASGSELAALRAEIELDYLKEDVPALMNESREGISRVRKIVQDLKDFSHVDAQQDWQWTDLHQGIDSTLNIVNNEIKYKADVVKQYGALPEVQCLASELNQVFMNLLVNAAHAIDKTRGTITIRTGVQGERVWVEVADDGCGIPKENQSRIFDPFFTTKPVGKGTGLGLSLSYGIVRKHGGELEVDSEPGRGTRFRMTIPVHRPEVAAPMLASVAAPQGGAQSTRERPSAPAT
jgi:two-component system, NtrC family, sensor kinase